MTLNIAWSRPLLRLSLPLALLLTVAAATTTSAAAAPAAAEKAPGAAIRVLPPITLALDASRVAQKILHVRLEIPVSPGPVTLLYPKWLPGEHGPTGPLANLVNLHFTAGGAELPWERDPLEMFALHLTVPAGAAKLTAEGDFLYPGEGGNFTSGAGATDAVAVINWNAVALYPQGTSADALRVAPSLRLPAGWSYGTPLVPSGESGGFTQFATVSLTNLIDSPVLAGAHLVDLDLGQGNGVPHHLVIAADRAADLDPAPELKASMQRLVAEALALFGARHYDSYRWLLTLSDHVQHFGLEHHQSSDDRVDEETLLQEASRRSLAGLLAHEYVHSWNGKYRRPAGLLSPDYLQPMRGELLWVYEGLTEHLGFVLPARAGFWTPDYYREHLAAIAAALDGEAGRRWRPLGDTAVAAQLLYGGPSEGRALRRSTDFYDESVFLWLDVDTLLRERSGGKVTLDDFCHRFHGGADSGPAVAPYTRDDLVETLNALVPYDWQSVLATHVDKLTPRLPMAGVERAGWRLVFNDQPNESIADRDKRRRSQDWRFSLGFEIDKDGVIGEILPDSPAGKAGMVEGEKPFAIGGHLYTPRALEAAVAEAKGSKTPIEVVVAYGDAVRTYKLDYHDGPRYPHLERIEGKPDLLAEILKARAAGKGK
jgi:predicted metalloprotease with PDZ domain